MTPAESRFDRLKEIVLTCADDMTAEAILVRIDEELRGMNVYIPKTNPTDRQIMNLKMWIDQFRFGLSIKELMEKYHLSESSVHRGLRAAAEDMK